MTAPEQIPRFDLYRELGVPPTADRATIEAAYRALMKLHHPDVAPDPRAGLERGKRLNVARQWLTDPERRRRFDASLGLDRPPIRNDWQPAAATVDDLLRVRVRPQGASSGMPFGSILAIGIMLLLGSLVSVGTGSLFALFAILTLPLGLMLTLYGGVGVVVGLFVRPPRP